MSVPAGLDQKFDYKQSEDHATHDQIDAHLDAFRAAHPGATIKKRQRMWSVTFDAAKQPTGSIISRDYAFPEPHPAEGSPEYIAYDGDMKKAAEAVADLDDLTNAERQYTVLGFFFDYYAGKACLTVTTSLNIFCKPTAKPLLDAEIQPLREAAKQKAREQNKLHLARVAAGEPQIVRAKDLRRDLPEMAAGLPADTPDDATLAVKTKDWNERHPKGWKPKGWTRKKEHAFQHWMADGTPGLEQHGEPFPVEDLREMFNDALNAEEQRSQFEREIAELVHRRSGGHA
jgi:hypothetical protein